MGETIREQRGKLLANSSRIKQLSTSEWVIPSQTNNGKYKVLLTPEGATCTCADYELTGKPCKHIYAAKSSENE